MCRNTVISNVPPFVLMEDPIDERYVVLAWNGPLHNRVLIKYKVAFVYHNSENQLLSPFVRGKIIQTRENAM